MKGLYMILLYDAKVGLEVKLQPYDIEVNFS